MTETLSATRRQARAGPWTSRGPIGLAGCLGERRRERQLDQSGERSLSASVVALMRRHDVRSAPAVPATASLTTSLRKIAMLGNHLPRRCGIATFTTHLSEAISTRVSPSRMLRAGDERREPDYAYPERVRFELAAANISSYQRAADFLNVGDVDLVSVQHEYGIFGGKAGSHVLALLRDLRMPIVTTLAHDPR
jgi:hypothetical protein